MSRNLGSIMFVAVAGTNFGNSTCSGRSSVGVYAEIAENPISRDEPWPGSCYKAGGSVSVSCKQREGYTRDNYSHSAHSTVKAAVSYED